MKIGFKFNYRACWIGGHISIHNKRLCINLLPMCTLWFVLEGGNIPGKRRDPDIQEILLERLFR